MPMIQLHVCVVKKVNIVLTIHHSVLTIESAKKL